MKIEPQILLADGAIITYCTIFTNSLTYTYSRRYILKYCHS